MVRKRPLDALNQLPSFFDQIGTPKREVTWNPKRVKQNLDPSKIEWDRIPTDPKGSYDRAMRYSGKTGSVQWVLLEISWTGSWWTWFSGFWSLFYMSTSLITILSFGHWSIEIACSFHVPTSQRANETSATMLKLMVAYSCIVQGTWARWFF